MWWFNWSYLNRLLYLFSRLVDNFSSMVIRMEILLTSLIWFVVETNLFLFYKQQKKNKT
jgi:hypothetical protein